MSAVLAFRHVPFEDLGLLQPVFDARGYAVRMVDTPISDLRAIDPIEPSLLVVLGGPIGAYEEALYPFLAQEIRLVERRLAAGRPTLGICLGAQIMAKALGARVYPNREKELGWAPVTATPAGKRTAIKHIEAGKTAVLHWHGDTFDLPDGATLLASTAACTNQAFALDCSLGLQFHAEAAGPALEAWYVGHALEIATTAGVTLAKLRADGARWSPIMTVQGRRFFEDWLASVGL